MSNPFTPIGKISRQSRKQLSELNKKQIVIGFVGTICFFEESESPLIELHGRKHFGFVIVEAIFLDRGSCAFH